MIYAEAEVRALYEESLAEAKTLLSTLKVAEGRDPVVSIGGWVLEQTVQYCLSRELAAIGLKPEISEQEPLKGRAKVDLLVGGTAAIELKVGGAFGAGDEKYVGYRKLAEARGWKYFYLTLQESHRPYKDATILCFGAECAYFLDDAGDWNRFVAAVAQSLRNVGQGFSTP